MQKRTQQDRHKKHNNRPCSYAYPWRNTTFCYSLCCVLCVNLYNVDSVISDNSDT